MKDLNTQLMTESLKKIVQTCGTDVLKNAARFRSAIEDFLPSFECKVERNILNMCVQVGISERLLLAKSYPTNDGKLRIKNKAVQTLTEDYSLANERAELVVKCFTEALNIDFDEIIVYRGSPVLSYIEDGDGRKVLPVILLVDVSEGMADILPKVNSAIERIVLEFRDLNRKKYRIHIIRFAILVFGGSNYIKWITGNTIVDPKCYAWPSVCTQGGRYPCLGKALRELYMTLHSRQHHLGVGRVCWINLVPPVLYLFSSCNLPCDYDDAIRYLGLLNCSELYEKATKISLLKNFNNMIKKYGHGICLPINNTCDEYFSLAKFAEPHDILVDDYDPIIVHEDQEERDKIAQQVMSLHLDATEIALRFAGQSEILCGNVGEVYEDDYEW